MQHLALPGAHLLKPPCTIFRTIPSHKFAYTEINTLYHPMMQLQAGGGQCPDAEEAKHAPDGGQYEEDNERLGPSRKRLKRGNPGKV